MQLRTWRTAEGKTLKDISDGTGISLSQVSKHERGLLEPDLEQVDKYRTVTSGAVVFEDWLDTRRFALRSQQAANDPAPAGSQPEETRIAR